MLICFSLSTFVFIFTSCHSCGRACACKLSLSVTRRETDGSRIKARVCFGKLRVGAVTRCKNNVIIEIAAKLLQEEELLSISRQTQLKHEKETARAV
ncbi:hypothetical protein AMECASPLE_014402 [Ameca splendens]|uniref:Secreted protein n=1 Tax=Ameca splendens TaxID=208324 RepID=A0ABV0XQK9_9TELE